LGKTFFPALILPVPTKSSRRGIFANQGTDIDIANNSL
jgi:hypothetical protein